MEQAKTTLSRRGFLAGLGILGASTAVASLSGCAPSTASDGGSGSAFSGAVPDAWDMEADIVIVGGGGAGLSAACTAIEAGASVIVLEKMSYLGGDTALSGQTFLGPWPEKQKELGVDDSIEGYLEDQIASNVWSAKGKLGESVPEETPLSTRLYELCGEFLEWSIDDIGIGWAPQSLPEQGPLTEGVLPQPTWNTKGARSWMAMMPPEASIFTWFNKAVDDKGINVRYKTEANSLIVDETGRVIGLYALDDRENRIAVKAAKAVILSAGSFCGDRGMMARYLPIAKGIQSGGCEGSTGDAHRMAQEIGAALVDMDLGVHWYAYEAGTNSGVFSTAMIFYGGRPGEVPISNIPGVLLNYNGERFVSESSGYKYIGEQTAQQPCQESWYILDSHPGAADVTFMIPYNDNRVVEADSLDKIAEITRLPKDTMLAQIDRYNGFVAAGKDDDFEKVLEGCQPIDQGPFYAICLRPRPYAPYGGISTDVESHVLNGKGDVIKGLYAAGICTGSYAEQEAMYYNGGVAQALVFGRQAAKNAVADEAWSEATPTSAQTATQSVVKIVDCSGCHSDGRSPGEPNYHAF